ncbi:hypothetical protein CYR55_20315 [Chimaeribacter californicus]|uniref:Uncharacterized protein n=1 Tax=Chimaeribacter californicus TaxID=2060067 RepID=A0A2N5DWN3_9GAMM|nr:hypothetical protein [Chimaeribacter californicus]PLR31674.1 hypothetical protein CYR55_20315 [Chimaeribacter californicus]
MYKIEVTSYRDTAEEEIAHLQAELMPAQVGIDVRHPPQWGPFATIELAVPALVVIAFAQTFLAALVGELAKDTYEWLKQRLGHFGRQVISRERIEPTLYGRHGPITRENPYSLALSLEAEAGHGARFRLYLPRYEAAFGYEAAIGSFVDFVRDYHAGRVTLADLGLDEEEPLYGNLIMVCYDEPARKLVWLDPIPPGVRRP